MNREDFVRKVKSAGLDRDEEKRIYIAGIINEVLKKHGVRLTVVGGAVVALLTAGYYTTADIDIVGKKPEIIRRVLRDLGFRSIGTENRFVHEDLGIIVEYMGEIPKAGRLDRVRVKDVEVEVVSLEDVVVDKLKLLEKGIDVKKSEAQVKVIAYLLEKHLDEEYLMHRLVRENLWELWTRIKAEVDEYGA
ncbi:DUF6036 family nucleotidyltransferase [Candidatus Pyrohabitans sp.]